MSGKDNEKLVTNPYPAWAARFWHGMRTGPWLRLLAKNRFRIHPMQFPLACTLTGATLLNSTLRPLQEAILGRKLAKVQVKDAPIFIVGHWRSGTTLLHEMMVLDQRYTFPTTYQCFAPNHFLISAFVVTRLRFLLPSRRPMDNMITGWERPQEEEFALCNMGIPSPYLTMIFPNEPPQYPEYLDLETLSAADRRRWQEALVWFLKRLTFRQQKRIILKSPPHLARIRALLEIFPDARFVHIVRNPYTLYASTIKLWKTLYQYQSLQVPRFEHLEEYVFSCFEKMYTAFEAQKSLLAPDRLYEVRYEDLVRDPVSEMRHLYEHLALGEFELLEPRLRDFCKQNDGYRTNVYSVEDELRGRIDERWGRFMRPYGYCQDEPRLARDSA